MSNIEGLGIILKPIVIYVGNINELEIKLEKSNKKINDLHKQLKLKDDALYKTNLIINSLNDQIMLLQSKIKN